MAALPATVEWVMETAPAVIFAKRTPGGERRTGQIGSPTNFGTLISSASPGLLVFEYGS
jgi:hypothetical protein